MPHKEVPAHFRLAGIPVHSSTHLGGSEGIGRVLTTMQLSRKIKNYSPKAVSIHVPGIEITYSDVMAARMSGAKRVIASVYSTNEALKPPSEGKRSVFNLLDAIIVPTPGLEAGMLASGVSEGKIRVVPNAVDFPEPGFNRNMARQRLRVPPGAFAIGTMSRLTRDRQIDQIIRACAASAQFKKHGFLVIAGDGVEMQRLKVMAADLIPAQHFFLNPVGEPSTLFSGIDLFVYASEPEEFGHAFAEAAAWWVPTVAYDMGAAQYAVDDGKTGFLTAPDKPEGMSEKIDFLIQDRTVLAHMAERARASAEKDFGPEKMASAYVELLHLKHQG